MSRRLLMTALVVFLSGCSLWGGGKKVSPPAPLPELERPIAVDEIWRLDLGAGAKAPYYRLVPGVAGTRLYGATPDGGLLALNAQTGEVAWRIKTHYRFQAGPGFNEQALFLGTRDGQVVAFDAQTGARRWRTQVTSEVTGVPRAQGDLVIVRTLDGRVAALDASTGTRRWLYEGTVPALTLTGTGSPVVAGDVVLVGLDNGKLVALRLQDGTVAWEQAVAVPGGRSEVERMVDVDADPDVAGDDVFAVAYQGRVVDLSAQTGDILWSRTLSSYEGLAASGSQLFVVDDYSHLSALDTRTGTSLWSLDKLYRRGLTGPAVQQAYVAVGDSEGYVHWIARDSGQVAGRYRVDSAGIASSPVVVGDTLYVLGRGGKVAALRLRNS